MGRGRWGRTEKERRGCLGGVDDGFWRGSGLKACGWEREVKGRWAKGIGKTKR